MQPDGYVTGTAVVPGLQIRVVKAIRKRALFAPSCLSPFTHTHIARMIICAVTILRNIVSG